MCANQGMSQKEELIAYSREIYGITGDHPFPRDLVSEVLRHPENRKWFALFMEMDRAKLGASVSENVTVMNLKCDPYLAGSVQDGRSIFPGYHMNRRNWITVVLDGSVSMDQLRSLLDLSYDLTLSGGKGGPRLYARDFIIPSNFQHFDVQDWLDHHETVTWHASPSMQTGDRVFIYIGVPFSAIMVQCRIEEMNLRRHCDGSTDTRPIMLLRPIVRYGPHELDRSVLREFGVTNVRGPRSMPESLSRYIDRISGQPEN